MGSILLRTLTLKSKINIGKYKDDTVSDLLARGKQKELISFYYKLTSINFTPDILKLLGIVDKWVIEKPSSNKDMYYQFLNNTGYISNRKNLIKNRNRAIDLMRAKTSALPKSYLANKNQGH